MMAASAFISEREYSTGALELKLRPSLAPGIVTALGLANDATKHSDPYIQLLIDAQAYGF